MKLILTPFLFALAGQLSAQENQVADSLFELSFEQLMQLEVTLASKSAERLSHSPSSVTLFTRDKINSLAVENVYELLNYVPGFQMSRGDWVGAVPKEHARGVFLDNGYVLFLINGERINEFSFGKASVYTPFIPLSLVERVEVIRGPGSALYGSNAFMGVVNIITRKQGRSIDVGIGENASYKLSAQYSQAFGDWQLQLDLDWRGAGGSSYLYQQQGVKDPYRHKYLAATLQDEKTRISARYQQSNLDEFINLGGASDSNLYHSENLALSVKHNWWQGEESSLQSDLLFSEHKLQTAGLIFAPGEIPNLSHGFFNGPDYITQALEFHTDFQYQLASEMRLNTGLTLKQAEQKRAGTLTSHLLDDGSDIVLEDRYHLGGIVAVKQFPPFDALKASQDAYGVYAQIQWQLTEKLEWLLGGRYDHVQSIGQHFSPRLALIYSLNPKHNLRLQYGEAFRTPVTNELFSSDSVTSGNPALSVEQIETLELVWHFSGQNSQFEAVYFHNQLQDFITRVEAPQLSSQFTFENLLDRDIDGVEVSGQWRFTERSEVYMGFTRIFSTPLEQSFQRFGHLGYRGHWNKWQLNLDGLWRGSMHVQHFYQAAYWLLNAKLIYQFNPQLKLSLSLNNLLDKSYKVYEPRVDSLAMPGRPRQTWLTMSYQLD